MNTDMNKNYDDIICSASRTQKNVIFNTSAGDNYESSEAYKTLRTNIMFCGNDIKTIVITSCNENEGKSTIASELTKSFADSGKHSLLIDADMRKSIMLKSNLRRADICGLSEVLSGLAEPEDAIYKTQDDNFDVMFSGHFPPNPVELLGNKKLSQMLQQFKKTYDYIIIDSPPLGIVIDAAIIASFSDAAVIVMLRHKTSRSAAVEIKNQLEKSGTRIIGAIINESEKHSGKYYSKRKKGYYQ